MPHNARMQSETTQWSPALIGFYASCAAVGLGAAMSAVMWIVFPGETFAHVAGTIGVLMIVIGSVTSLRCLRAARNED